MILIMPLIYILSIVFPCYRMITAGLIYIYKVCRTNYLALSAGPSNIMIFNTKCKKVDIREGYYGDIKNIYRRRVLRKSARD